MTDPDNESLEDKLAHDWLMEQEYDRRAMRRMRDEERDMEDMEEEYERD